MISYDEMITLAGEMVDPGIFADTSGGSGQALFFLVDADSIPLGDDLPQISRATFNRARKIGMLDGGSNNRLRFGIYQAWKVEIPKDGSENPI